MIKNITRGEQKWLSTGTDRIQPNTTGPVLGTILEVKFLTGIL